MVRIILQDGSRAMNAAWTVNGALTVAGANLTVTGTTISIAPNAGQAQLNVTAQSGSAVIALTATGTNVAGMTAAHGSISLTATVQSDRVLYLVTSNHRLELGTNNTSRVFIQTTGEVGVGVDPGSGGNDFLVQTAGDTFLVCARTSGGGIRLEAQSGIVFVTAVTSGQDMGIGLNQGGSLVELFRFTNGGRFRLSTRVTDGSSPGDIWYSSSTDELRWRDQDSVETFTP